MKTATIFVCTKCDAQTPKWTGQCLECGNWGTVAPAGQSGLGRSELDRIRKISQVAPAKIEKFSEIKMEFAQRRPIGIEEIDRAFGGGIVPGSVTLIGGEPGIGKSTICLQIATRLSVKDKVLYASGEESGTQVKSRAERLGSTADNLFFLGETEVETIIATLQQEKPVLAVIDSVQMLRSADIPAEAGAVSTIRGATAKLVEYAKSSGTPLLLVGHVTKDGNVAGPKTLEHLVDAVLSFEGERTGQLRLLRVLKNRFGSTDETGIFEMTGEGLKEIKNPSAYMLDERGNGTSGDIVSCILEGTRPVLVDIQALVTKTAFGYPTRRASGLDQSRLEMLIAVLAARGGLDLGQQDVYVNIIGGLKLKDPSIDLAIILALASAYRNLPLKEAVVWGEVGLGGEVRPVAATDRRLIEAARLGLRYAIAPLPRKKTSMKLSKNIDIKDVHSVRDALMLLKSEAK
ncbi:DNA repair protein RadA [Patescibacteria group bacterium]|nr:DNA repair protein RadA [Patescibacteria group bacterium]